MAEVWVWESKHATPLWRAWDQLMTLAALFNTASYVLCIHVPLPRKVQALAAVAFSTHVLQLAWMRAFPASYTWRCRTAVMLMHRAVRVVVLQLMLHHDPIWPTYASRVVADAAAGSPTWAAVRCCAIGTLALYPLMGSHVCYLPVRWSLPALAWQVGMLLWHQASAVGHLLQPAVLPGTRALLRGACTALLWLAGKGALPSSSSLSSSATSTTSTISEASGAVLSCDLLTPLWLVRFSILFVGLVVPLWSNALWESCVARHVAAKRQGRNRPALAVLGSAVVMGLAHVPVLAVAAVALALGLALMDPQPPLAPG